MRVVVTGANGQDGRLLTHFLRQKGYYVLGTTRGCTSKKSAADECYTLSLSNSSEVSDFIHRVKPRKIFHLACQSSVSLAEENPRETLESIINSTTNLLDAIKKLNPKIRFFHASSSEVFGSLTAPATASTKMEPQNIYGVAKKTASEITKFYRENYGLYTCNGFLFNHESHSRSDRFVTMKIAKAAANIAHGRETEISIGNLSIIRDWGWAEEFVEAMSLMLEQDDPKDLIIATGKSYSLENFTEKAFSSLNLDWTNFVKPDNNLFRKNDIKATYANVDETKTKIGWKAKKYAPEIARELTLFQYKKLAELI